MARKQPPRLLPPNSRNADGSEAPRFPPPPNPTERNVTITMEGIDPSSSSSSFTSYGRPAPPLPPSLPMPPPPPPPP
eukprot:6710607-Pyramimonas_sp.AAC.1